MCIAILNSRTTLSDNTIKNSWENNDQGAGLLYNHKGKLTTFKTYNYKDFLRKYKELRKDNSVKKIVLHFRIATSGHEPYTNLHPFMINEKIGFVHNGIISGLGNQQYSDTYQFNEMLKKLPSNFLNCSTTKELIKEYISGSKLLFLDHNDKHTIINEHFGHWDKDENWYSNNSYQQNLDFFYFGNQKVSKTNVTTKKSKKIKESEEENIEYLNYVFTNVNLYRLETFSELVNIPLSNPEILGIAEELTNYYNTYDIQKLNSLIIQEEQETFSANYNNHYCDF